MDPIFKVLRCSSQVHRFEVLVPAPVFFLGRLSEDVATRLSACYLISLTEAAHRYLDDLTKRDMLGTRALNLVCIKLGKNGKGVQELKKNAWGRIFW